MSGKGEKTNLIRTLPTREGDGLGDSQPKIFHLFNFYSSVPMEHQTLLDKFDNALTGWRILGQSYDKTWPFRPDSINSFATCKGCTQSSNSWKKTPLFPCGIDPSLNDNLSLVWIAKPLATGPSQLILLKSACLVCFWANSFKFGFKGMSWFIKRNYCKMASWQKWSSAIFGRSLQVS